MPSTPRLRTLANHPGPEVEVNGVLIPADQWSFSHGPYSTAPVEVDVRFLAEFVPDEPEPCAEPEPVRSPRLAEAVHYVSHGTPGGEYGRECRAAIVTATNGGNEDIFVGLCVLNPTGQFFNPRVMRDDRRGLWESSNVPGYRGGTWHFADGCQGAEDEPDADCCAIAPDVNECAPEPVVHLTLSGIGAPVDVDALISKFAKKANAVGLHVGLA